MLAIGGLFKLNKDDLQKAIIAVKKNSPKRKFKQSLDLIIAIKSLDLKKTDNHVDLFVQLPHKRNKKVRVCALVGPELREAAKAACDTAVNLEDFDKYAKDKSLVKKLAEKHDFFIAQANIMPKVASSFGRVLGPKGKMPNPKAGCIVPPNANLAPIMQKLQNTLRVSVKTAPLMQCRIGEEDTSDNDLIDNALFVYTSLVHALPNEKHNIKCVYTKLTMGPCLKVGDHDEEGNAEGKSTSKSKKNS